MVPGFVLNVQASGMLSVPSKHHLAPLLLPVAVEASWRLQRWPLLHDLLLQVSENCHAVFCFLSPMVLSMSRSILIVIVFKHRLGHPPDRRVHHRRGKLQ